MSFNSAEAKPLPTLACIGRVINVGEPKLTASGVYTRIPIEIEGYGASKNGKVNFMYRPDWLIPGFSPESLKQYEGGNSLYFMFGKNINQEGQISVLRGLVGDDNERFDKLAESLQAVEALPEFTEDSDPDDVRKAIAAHGERVAEVLATELVENELGVHFGYIQKQQMEDAGVDEETGKKIRKRGKFYEVAEFGSGDQKWRDRQYKRAGKTTDGSFKVQFTEDDVPF